MTPQPAPVALVAQYTGVPGSTSLYYWVQAIYPSGNSVLSGYCLVSNTASLTSGNQVGLSWRPVPGAIKYNVIRTTTSSPPAVNSTTTVALALGITSTGLTDQGQPLMSFTYETGTGGTGTNVQVASTVVTGGTPGDILVVGSLGTLDQQATIKGIQAPTNLIISFSGLGVDASGGAANATVTGVKNGDVLILALDMTDNTDVTAKFGSTANGNNTVSQLNTNLSAKTIRWLFLSQQS